MLEKLQRNLRVMTMCLLYRLGSPLRGQRGQSLIIIAVAFVAILVIVGLALDLGLVYVERVKLSRAVDAAALAGAQELPLEEQAWARALEYLRNNGYDSTNSKVEINGVVVWDPPDAKATIKINTEDYRDKDLPLDEQLNTADKIRVEGEVFVPMLFLGFLGRFEAPVSGMAVAENINNLDVVIVLDRSGSMQEDTRCYGCYYKPSDAIYPSGERHYLPFPYDTAQYDPDDGPWPPSSGPCAPLDPLVYNGDYYIVIEAEHYSYANHDYHREYVEWGETYWTLQRGDRLYSWGWSNAGATGPDSRGAFIMHLPHSNIRGYFWDEIGDNTPRVDYEITFPGDPHTTYRYYLWIRGQGGTYSGSSSRVDGRIVHFGVDGVKRGSSSTSQFYRGGYARGVIGSTYWRWARMRNHDGSTFTLDVHGGETHTLNFWGGGMGFRLDKIVLTTSSANPPTPLRWNGSWPRSQGPDETQGVTGWACQPCDPRYGLYVEGECDNRMDDLFDDMQPIRSAKEAAKNFIARLNPRYDQVGYVYYSSSASIRRELECIKRLGSACTSFDTVINAIESTQASGSTNIADGIIKGIEVLQTGGGHYGRPTAAHIMVLMTDGQANQVPNTECYQEDLWPDSGLPTQWERAKDCVIYYAQEAANNSIVIYTISLGAQADIELMQRVAELTGGEHYYAPSAQDLDQIFQEIADHIFLRLVR